MNAIAEQLIIALALILAGMIVVALHPRTNAWASVMVFGCLVIIVGMAFAL